MSDDEKAGSRGRRGRPPRLSSRGRLIGASALVLLVLGLVADRADLVALGSLLVGFLFVVLASQYPAATFVWRRYVELAWRIERPAGDPALYAGRALSLTIELRNHAPRALGLATLRPMASPGLDVATVRVRARAAADAVITLTVVPRSVGFSLLHGVAIELGDPLGLTELEAYFPSPIALTIVPRDGAPLPVGAAPLALAPERAQRSVARLVGQGGDLRELREHRPGDPWKQIAWKATARRGRLMVRELERETQSSHLIVLDVSGRMREGAPGGTPLDRAVDICARYVRGVLDAGDRVGLVMVDGRPIASVPISDRPGQRRRLTELVTHAGAVYDEDRTDISDAELCATVGRYLLLQEGEESRVTAPPVEDPMWSNLVAAPTGELYELRRLLAAVQTSRRRLPSPGQGQRPPHAGDPIMADLRAYCRDRAIPLPPRLEPGRGARGLAALLATLRTGRAPDRVLVLSMLDGIDVAESALADELVPVLAEGCARLRRRGARVTLVAPIDPEPTTHDPIDELLRIESARRATSLAGLSRRLGVTLRLCSDPTQLRLDRGGVARPMGRAA